MNRITGSLVIGVLTLLSLGCGGASSSTNALEATELPPAEPAFVHAYSGMVFPGHLEGFERREIRDYDDEGRNTSVGYVDELGVIVTVYIYPVPAEVRALSGVLQQEFEEAAMAIAYYYSGLAIEEVTEVVREQGGRQTRGLHLHATGYLERESGWERVHTFLYVFRQGDWFIKYRATYDFDLGNEGRDRLEHLMDALRWPPLGVQAGVDLPSEPRPVPWEAMSG